MHKLIRVLSSRLFLVIALVIAQIYFLLAYICQFSYVNNLTPLFTLIGLLLAFHTAHTIVARRFGGEEQCCEHRNSQ